MALQKTWISNDQSNYLAGIRGCREVLPPPPSACVRKWRPTSVERYNWQLVGSPMQYSPTRCVSDVYYCPEVEFVRNLPTLRAPWRTHSMWTMVVFIYDVRHHGECCLRRSHDCSSVALAAAAHNNLPLVQSSIPSSFQTSVKHFAVGANVALALPIWSHVEAGQQYFFSPPKTDKKKLVFSRAALSFVRWSVMRSLCMLSVCGNYTSSMTPAVTKHILAYYNGKQRHSNAVL